MKNKRTLLVEAGGTKSDWALIDGEAVVRARTAGINVSTMSREEILAVAREAVGILCSGQSTNLCSGADAGERSGVETDEIQFYGAGLVSEESVRLVQEVMKAVFPTASVTCGTDLLAAGRACFGSGEGIVAILGTGSNSGVYDGREIVQNVRPGGFILGDEGSGAALGKAFISDWLKGLLPEGVERAFEEKYAPTYGEVVKNVYSGPAPAAYLASFAPFILSLAADEYVAGMVELNISRFIERSLAQYDWSRYEVAFVGSFGAACEAVIRDLVPVYGFKIAGFVPEPMERLVEMALKG